MGTMEGSYNTYIGARYVPIFDGNWDNTKAYEPLVIVQHQGNSYTSKTYVPVGADINDEKYWAPTGNYNAQVEQYRQEVVQYSQNVDKLEEFVNNLSLSGKNVHFFGDSLTWGLINGTQSAYNYPKVFAQKTGCNSINNAVNGATVCEIDSANNWLITQINSANLTDADYIFIQMGINDFLKGYPIGKETDDSKRFKGAYYKCLQTIIEKAKNGCKIICLTLFPNTRYFTNSPNTTGLYINDYNTALKEVCNNLNIQIINTTDTIGINKFNYAEMTTDGLHLTDKAYYNVGIAIAQAISNGYSDKNIYSGENIVSGEDFYNSFSLENEFPNGSHGILLDLKGGSKSSYNKYLFSSNEYYTLTCDIYNENNVNPSTQTFIKVLIQLKSETSDYITIATFNNPGLNVTHFKTTFRVNKTDNYIIRVLQQNNLSTLSQISLSSLSITRGDYPLLPSNPQNRAHKLTELGVNIEPVASGQFILMSNINGIVKLNGQFKATATIPANSIIVSNIPPIGNLSANRGFTTYIKGFNSSTYSFVPFAVTFGGNLTNVTQLPAGNYVITDCLPIYF